MKHCSGQTDAVMSVSRRQTGESSPDVQWADTPHRRSDFLKNLSVASALLICIVMLRSGANPRATSATDAVLASARQDSLLNEDIGKLTFVSALFPEAVLVFGDSGSYDVAMPVSASGMIHSWSTDEPYTAWTSDDTGVYAGISGEVVGVYHGMDEELIIQITDDRQTSCIAGNLVKANVAAGDSVSKGDLIGWIDQGSYCTFEVQQNGLSLDPLTMLEGR